MAKGKNRNRAGNRDHNSIASSLAFRPTVSRSTFVIIPADRREFDPDPYVARSFSNRSARVTVAPPTIKSRPAVRNGRPKFFPSREQHVFAAPQSVAICVRRKQRREVLFAKKLKTSGRGRSKRRNYHSNIRC